MYVMYVMYVCMYVCMYRSAKAVWQLDQRSSFVIGGERGIRGVVSRIECELDEAIQRQLLHDDDKGRSTISVRQLSSGSIVLSGLPGRKDGPLDRRTATRTGASAARSRGFHWGRCEPARQLHCPATGRWRPEIHSNPPRWTRASWWNQSACIYIT